MDVTKFPALVKIVVAKRMVTDNDYVGARLKLLELHYQFPSLGNLLQMITACDVLCASELTSSDGEIDWYWVLQLSPAASISQIRLRHKKLITILEGIKSEFPGAFTALKLVHDAFFTLSNPSKRLVFDSKRLTNLSVCELSVWSHSESSASMKKDDSNVLEDDEKGSDPIELDEPIKQPQDEKNLNIDYNSHESLENGALYDVGSDVKPENFDVGQIWAAFNDENFPRRYARIHSISESPFRLVVTWLRPVPENGNEVKWCEAKLPVVCGLFILDGENETVVDYSIFSHWVSYTANPTYDEFVIHPQEDEIWAIYENWRPFEWCENPEYRKECTFKIIQILYHKEEEDEGVIIAKPFMETKEGQESIEIPLTCLYRFSHRLPSYESKESETSHASFGALDVHPSPISNESLLKAEWSPVDFTPDQVWAIYEGLDQMPRQYAVVNNLMSNSIVSVNLLDPNPNPSYVEEISWVVENIPLGCGVFRTGGIAAYQISKFSHLVNCEKIGSFYRIYPRKGEIWAIYRNWSGKWKKQDHDHSRYQIVRITSDFDEQSGIQVASLEQVPGYKTLFQNQHCDGFVLNRTIKRSEMLIFSHRVEAYIVLGAQAHGIPDCCWHLEPDALPRILSN